MHVIIISYAPAIYKSHYHNGNCEKAILIQHDASVDRHNVPEVHTIFANHNDQLKEYIITFAVSRTPCD